MVRMLKTVPVALDQFSSRLCEAGSVHTDFKAEVEDALVKAGDAERLVPETNQGA